MGSWAFLRSMETEEEDRSMAQTLGMGVQGVELESEGMEDVGDDGIAGGIEVGRGKHEGIGKAVLAGIAVEGTSWGSGRGARIGDDGISLGVVELASDIDEPV